ncbi:MAG TPA: preprotein translocase subunit SecE [Ktedonobacterales bacterium]
MASRTIDKGKRPAARAANEQPLEDEQGPEMGPEDEAEGIDDEGPDASDALDADAEDEGVDEDLRVTGGALAMPRESQIVTTSARGLRVPAWMMANPITRYLVECANELLKVTWPDRRDAWNSTLVVIAMSVVVSVILGAADFGLNQLVAWIVSHA